MHVLQMVQKHLIQLIPDHVPVTDTIPPTVPTVDTDLTGKATTLTPITVTTDPNTRVDLIDKMGIL